MANLIKMKLDTVLNRNRIINLMQNYTYDFEFELTTDGVPTTMTGATPKIEMLKADGTYIVQTNDIVISGSKATGKINKFFTQIDGMARLQFILTKGADVFGSWVIKCNIKPSAVNGNEGESTNELTLIEELKFEVDKAQIVKEETEILILNGGAATKGEVNEVDNRLSSQLADITQFKNVKDFGIIPDGVTNWETNGKLDIALRWSSENKFPIYFPKGDYNCPMNNYYSDVTVIFEEGAVFCGTIHTAINRISGTPSDGRPKNVRFLGTIASYDRVGGYNNDKHYVEKIKIISDPTKQMQGRKPAGVHYYLDTQDLEIGEIDVEDVADDMMYGLGVDGNSTYEPKNCRIGKVTIRDSAVNGVYLCGENNNIDEVVINGYGYGTQTRALPMALPAECTELKGVWSNRTKNCTIGKLTINQKDGTRTNATDGYYGDDGVCTVIESNINKANRHGFRVKAQVESPNISATKINCTNCGGNGVSVENGTLTCMSINSTDNGGNGVYMGANVKLNSFFVIASRNALEQILGVGGSKINSNLIELSGMSNATKYNIFLSGALKSNVGILNVVSPTKGANGGIRFTNCDDIIINKLSTMNSGKDASLCALLVETSKNINIMSGLLKNGLGQGLRMVTLENCNFNGLTVDGHDANVIGSGLTNCGFMNCISKNAVTTRTNLSSASASYFNSNTMYS